VIQWLRSHIDEPIDARKFLDEILAQAKRKNKRVLVQETATWCGPCHMLPDYPNDNREWETDYIWIKMDHRFTGARELMAELRAGASGGIPWFAILDADGKKLATSPTDDQVSGFVAGPKKRRIRRQKPTNALRPPFPALAVVRCRRTIIRQVD